jgi:hypothetical protein
MTPAEIQVDHARISRHSSVQDSPDLVVVESTFGHDRCGRVLARDPEIRPGFHGGGRERGERVDVRANPAMKGR